MSLPGLIGGQVGQVMRVIISYWHAEQASSQLQPQDRMGGRQRSLQTTT